MSVDIKKQINALKRSSNFKNIADMLEVLRHEFKNGNLNFYSENQKDYEIFMDLKTALCDLSFESLPENYQITWEQQLLRRIDAVLKSSGSSTPRTLLLDLYEFLAKKQYPLLHKRSGLAISKKTLGLLVGGFSLFMILLILLL